jgi:hypothetical protein
LVTNFQIVLGGENWNEVLYQTMYAAVQDEVVLTHPVLPVIYFTVLIIMGQFMILNLFLAILLANFVPSEFGTRTEEEEQEEVEEVEENNDAGNDNDAGNNDNDTNNESCYIIERQGSHYKYNAKVISCGCFKHQNVIRQRAFQLIDHRWFESVVVIIVFISCITLIFDVPSRRVMVQSIQLANQSSPSSQSAQTSQTSQTSAVVGIIVSEKMILGKKIIIIINWFVSIFFLVEMILKMIALGIWHHTGAYMKSWWNIFDGLLVLMWVIGTSISFITDIAGLVDGAENVLSIFLVMRSFRTLKALRMVENYSSLRHVANTIILSMPRMTSVILLLLFFWIMFGILGMRLWMGAFHHCNDNAIVEKHDCIGYFNVTMKQCDWMPTERDKITCLLNSHPATSRLFPRTWENISPWDFDHLLNAVLTVFVATSGETWPNMMYDAINARGQNLPMRTMHPAWPIGLNMSKFCVLGRLVLVTFKFC